MILILKITPSGHRQRGHYCLFQLHTHTVRWRGPKINLPKLVRGQCVPEANVIVRAAYFCMRYNKTHRKGKQPPCEQLLIVEEKMHINSVLLLPYLLLLSIIN